MQGFQGLGLSAHWTTPRRSSLSTAAAPKFIDADTEETLDAPDLVKAAKDGDLATVQSLYKSKGSNPNAFYRDGANKWTLLHQAADKNQPELIKWLLKKHASPDVRDSLLWSPLHCAAVQGHHEAVASLLKGGCDVNVRNSERTTALHYLVRRDMDEKLQRTLEAFIKAGADLNAKNCFDETPLQAAVTRARMSTVKWLIEHGADVNAVNKFGETALMKAVSMRDEGLCQALLEKGADPTFRSDSPIGDPVAVATNANRMLLVALLEDATERWLRRHPRDSPEDLKWGALTPAEQLQQTPMVAKEVRSLPTSKLTPLGATLATPPLKLKDEAWEGWLLEHQLPKRPPEQLDGALFPPLRFAEQFAQKDPLNLLGALVLGKADPEPMLISIERADVLEGEVEAILWTVRGSVNLTVPHDLVKGDDASVLKKLLKYFREYFAQKYAHTNERVNCALELAPETPEFRSALIALEADDPQTPHHLAVGLLYVKSGQLTEEEALGNDLTNASPAFNDFLAILGRKVVLADHKHYKADLDVSGRNMTGTHSVFHRGEGAEMMFHVCPMLPSLLDEEGQQMVRKRFLGNDLTAVVFLEPGAEFTAPIRSQMLHIYVVVQPVEVAGKPHYHVAVVRKEEVPAYEPWVSAPSLFSAETLRVFLRSKLVRGHLAALRSPKLTKLLVLGPKAVAYTRMIREHGKGDAAKLFEEKKTS